MLKSTVFALAILLLSSSVSRSQETIIYEIVVTPGDSARKAGDIRGAIKAYQNSIAAGTIHRAGETYNLACAFSRAAEQDSAIKYLEQYLALSHDSNGHELSDPDFVNIRKSPKWSGLEDRIINAYSIKNKVRITDMAYAKALWHLKGKDQAYYDDIELAKSKTGPSSTVVLALWDLKTILGDENQRELEALIRQKGWPRISAVGKPAASAAFLVIQHADLEKQQKYLPVIEALCKTGEARWQDYALMYDRIQTTLNKPQRYGSQVRFNDQTQKYELFALEDISKVDEWRKEAGLQPLAAYLANWKIAWPPVK